MAEKAPWSGAVEKFAIAVIGGAIGFFSRAASGDAHMTPAWPVLLWIFLAGALLMAFVFHGWFTWRKQTWLAGNKPALKVETLKSVEPRIGMFYAVHSIELKRTGAGVVRFQVRCGVPVELPTYRVKMYIEVGGKNLPIELSPQDEPAPLTGIGHSQFRPVAFQITPAGEQEFKKLIKGATCVKVSVAGDAWPVQFEPSAQIVEIT